MHRRTVDPPRRNGTDTVALITATNGPTGAVVGAATGPIWALNVTPVIGRHSIGNARVLEPPKAPTSSSANGPALLIARNSSPHIAVPSQFMVNGVPDEERSRPSLTLSEFMKTC